MSLKRLADLSKKFQAKLAQKPGPKGIAPSDLPMGGAANPYGTDAPFGGTAGDPFGGTNDMGAITDVRDYNRPAANKPGPNSKVKPTQMAFSVEGPEQFADIKKMLDIGVPGTKGVLRLTVSGNSIKPSYNKSRWNVHPKEVKRLLMNALSPTYTVEDPIGYINPDWSTNSDPNSFTY